MKHVKIVSVAWRVFISVMFLSVLFMQSCKKERSACVDCLHEIYVPLLEDANTDYPVVSQLFSSIDTIYLENPGPESYVPSVDEVRLLGDTVIVRSQSTLFFFDRMGHFLYRFNRQGNGYGHYRRIEHFDLLPSEGEMILFDDQSAALFIYDMSGRFKRTVYLEDFVLDFAVLPNGEFLLVNPLKSSGSRGYSRRGMWQVDAEGHFKKMIISFDDEFLHVSKNNPYFCHLSPDVIGFMGVEDNDLFYHVAGDSVSVTCKMTTDIVMPEKIRKLDNFFINPELEYTKCGYMETERFLFFVSTNYGANLVMTLVDKKEWKTYNMYVYSEEFNRNAEQIEQFPYLVNGDKGSMIGFFDAGNVLSLERHRRVFPTMTEDSNPVILLYND